MILTDKEELLVQTVRSLPPPVAEQILRWASQLVELAHGTPIEWSDAWSEADMADTAATSARNLEKLEQQPN